MKKKFLGVLCIAICFGMIFTGCSKVKDALSGNDSGSGAATEEDEELESDGFINFEKMQFYINGKAYTLGKTTLQEMIDDGVPFKESHLANAGNNLSGNTRSQAFEINLGDYWSAMLYVINDTSKNKVTSDCVIHKLYFPNIVKRTQDVLTFDFPITLTEDDLKELSVKPSNVSEKKDEDYASSTYEYKRKSTKFFGDWGYDFQFVNGELTYFTMDYLE